MGCGASKIDDSPPVTLCRDRKDLIKAAADRRYTMAAAHADYLRSLAGVGDAIHKFVHEELAAVPSPPPLSSPVITLPPTSKSKSDGSVTPLSHSLSPDDGDGDSHIHFSSESEKSLKSSPRISVNSTIENPDYGFMRSSTGIPSMVYQNPYTWDLPHDYPYNYPVGLPPERDPVVERSSPPPPPPPAEGGSAWDFFNPFSSYEQVVLQEEYYGAGSQSSTTNSSEVREREGIPDLEEDTEQEMLKAARKGKKVVDGHSRRNDFGEGTSKSMPEKGRNVEDSVDLGGKESSKVTSTGEEEGPTKDKEVILEEESSMVTEESGPSNVDLVAARGTRDLMEVAKEIKELFKSVTACGEEVSRMLELGKVNYRSRSRISRGGYCIVM